MNSCSISRYYVSRGQSTVAIHDGTLFDLVSAGLDHHDHEEHFRDLEYSDHTSSEHKSIASGIMQSSRRLSRRFGMHD